MAKRKPPIFTGAPRRIWFLYNHDNEGWVYAIDGAVDVIMAFDNLRDAKSEAFRQNQMYDLDCEAVLVK